MSNHPFHATPIDRAQLDLPQRASALAERIRLEEQRMGWAAAELPPTPAPAALRQARPSGARGPAPRPVVNDAGERFASPAEAGKAYNRHPHTVMDACRHSARSYFGRRWRYADMARPASWDDPRPYSNRQNLRPVVLADGRAFPCIYVAASALNVCRRTLDRYLRKGRMPDGVGIRFAKDEYDARKATAK